MTESQLQKAVLDWLQYLQNSGRPIYFFRSGAGAVRTDSGRYFKTGKPGCPDITVIIAGKYYGLELKSATGRQSEAQKLAQAQIEAAGGEYYIIRGMDDIKRITARLSN